MKIPNLFVFITLLMLPALFHVPACAGDRPSSLKNINIDGSHPVIDLEDSSSYIIKIETDYCKWCHVMNRMVYSRPDVYGILNSSTTVLTLNLRERSDITFDGRPYIYHPAVQVHGLAIYLSKNSLNLPVTVFINKSKGIHQVYNGYMVAEEFKKELADFLD